MLYEDFVHFTSNNGEQMYGHCPFHVDKTPSFTVNTETEEWYCHSCQDGGKEVEFIASYFDVTKHTASFVLRHYREHHVLPFPTQQDVDMWRENLRQREREVKVLLDFGITQEVIDKYELGLQDDRIMIPVRSRTGHIVNVRKYLPPHRRTTSAAKCMNIKGLGAKRFYPYDTFKSNEEIYIVEGEKDCLVAKAHGLNAITSTGGSSIPVHELQLFRNKAVTLMLDSDSVGSATAQKYANLLMPIASSIRMIELPVKDFSDYVQAFTVADLDDYATVITEGATRIENDQVEEVSLVRSEFSEHLSTWIKLNSMSVVGAEPKIYTIPKRLRATCRDTKCTRPCPLASGISDTEHIVVVDSRHLLQFIDAADKAQDEYVRKSFGCKSVVAEPVDFVNVQKIIFQESASFIDGLEEASFENRYGIYLYTDFRLQATLRYNFEACRVTDPRTQQNYYVIRHAESVAALRPVPTDESFQRFAALADSATSCDDLLARHYEEWMPTLGIEGRPDLFGAILLTFCSVTEIPWQAGVVKGWLDTMVIGDTRTGKSQLAQRLIKYIGMGGYINGENARRTGVIGGVQRFGDSWVVTWGAIPMNDRGLLIIDEASGLSIDDVKDLSSTRSSGAVTINKVVKGEARARTRLIWLSNPRSGKNLDEYYWKGYGAFQEFIPVAEDQARYDIVLSASREDVEYLEGIDSEHEPDHKAWTDLFHFAWALEKEQIEINNGLVQKVRDYSKKLGQDLGGGPLVVGVAAHEKILRLSCAFAILCGSIKNGRLIIHERHLKFADDFLRSTLGKDTFGYSGFIAESQRAKNRTKENTTYIKGLLTLHPALRILLSSVSFKGYQFQEILGISRDEASKIMSELITRGLVKPSSGANYVPDKMLIEVAKQSEVR